ncbi:MAG: hypothetical protein LQ351_008093 [Letrouitia transgressa]|nr:MAG: hypothetical protein LQ351_008093 [Letrouitia transgressa]
MRCQFEKVFVINLASRTDKLDAMRLSASLSGFNFEVIKGNLGKDIPEKALPGPVGKGPLKDNIIGCWRSHLDFAHTIVKKRLSSALVFEDDADWDVSFRSLLQYFALGSQMLLSSPANEPPQSPLKAPRSPYGDGWDLLWLGHCASHTSTTDHRRFVISNDPSTTPPNHRTNFGGVPDMSPYDNTTRIVFMNSGGTCLYSYALSYRGAQKMIFYNSMNYQDHPIDFGINDLCKLPERNFKCVGIFPQIVDNHRAAGTRGKDSDISKIGEDKGERKQGFSYNIVTSVRMNAGKLIDGDMDGLTPQWAEELPKLQGGLQTKFDLQP